MFEINEHVLYSTTGVCKVKAIGELDFNPGEDYYVLETVFTPNSTTIYVPVKNNLNIRKLLSVEQVHELIDSMPEVSEDYTTDDKQRMNENKEKLRQCLPAELIEIVKSLYKKKQDLSDSGKKMRMSDEQDMQKAEKILYDEFAIVLGITPEEVLDYIEKRLS